MLLKDIRYYALLGDSVDIQTIDPVSWRLYLEEYGYAHRN